MIRLSKFDGGRGYYVDDVKSLQQQLDLYRKFLLTGRGNFVLGGCTVSATTIATGLVVLNGRCIEVPALTASQWPAYLVQDTDASEGVRSFDLEGASFPAFVRERVKLVYANPGGNYIQFASTGAKDAIDRISELLGISSIVSDIQAIEADIGAIFGDLSSIEGSIISINSSISSLSTNKANKALATAWTNLPLLTGAVAANTQGSAQFGDTYTPAYCKDSFGFVHLRGVANHSDVGFAQLPAGFRTLKRVFYNDEIYIDPNGIAQKAITTAGVNENTILDGITFYAEA